MGTEGKMLSCNLSILERQNGAADFTSGSVIPTIFFSFLTLCKLNLEKVARSLNSILLPGLHGLI